MLPRFASRTDRQPLVAFLACALLASQPAVAENSGDLDRWAPSLAFSFDLLSQKADGEIVPSDVLGPPLPDGCITPAFPAGSGELCPAAETTLLRNGSSSSDTMVAPLVAGSLELMTPSLVEGFLAPRVFVHGDLSLSFGEDRNVAGEGSPDVFAIPPDLPPTTPLTENIIAGQGSRAVAEVDDLVFSAGVGVAFTVDVLGRTVRVKPSFEYLFEEIELTGVLNRAVQLRVPADSSSLVDFRLISLSSRKTESYHAIGPGLELETDSRRLGPFKLSVFALGRGYYFLGSLDETLTASNEFGETVTWNFDKESWAFRAGVGLRFRLIPE